MPNRLLPPVCLRDHRPMYKEMPDLLPVAPRAFVVFKRRFPAPVSLSASVESGFDLSGCDFLPPVAFLLLAARVRNPHNNTAGSLVSLLL